MKMTQTKTLLAAVTTAVVMTASANAAVVIQDTFSGTTGVDILGQTPDTVNTAGNTYSRLSSGGGATQQMLYSSGELRTGFNHAAYIQYTNTGTPTDLITLSLDARMGTIEAGGGNQRGIALGFYSAAPTTNNSQANFTGLLIQPDGSLRYYRNGGAQSTTSTALAGFSKDSTYTLTYTVDPTAGTITSVSYGGTDYTATFSGITNFLADDEAGFYGNTANNANFTGFVDNFIVDVVPEPGSLALLGLGGMLIASRRRRG